MKAEIISIGTELLVGSILNTNARFLSQKLAQNAIDVYRQTTVGDNIPRIVEALQNAFDRADLLVTSGGLGPTEDDVTAKSVAKFLNCPLIFHDLTYKRILGRFRKRHLPLSKMTRSQCFVPKNAIVFNNEKGTAPGLLCRVSQEGRTSYLMVLPGPPRELEPLFEIMMARYLKVARVERQEFVVRAVRIAALLETQVAQKTSDLLRLKPPTTVGIYAKPGEVELKIMAKARTLSQAKKNADQIESKIRKRFGNQVYGIDQATLSSATGQLLLKHKATLALAESCTGGLVSHLLTQDAGSSAYLKGALVCYSNNVKVEKLGIPEALLKKFGAVSAPVAKKMAENARLLFGTSWGVGITGIAGPSGGSAKKPVGLVYIALSSKAGTNVFQFRFLGNRSEIKFTTAQKALDLLRLALLKTKKS